MKLIEKIFILYYRIRLSLILVLGSKKAAAFAFKLFVTPIRTKTKNNIKLPKGAEPLVFDFENKKVHGYRWGNSTNQKVLILHGFSSTLTKFLHYVEPLVQNGMEVYAFDAPAHGISEGNTINVLQYRDLIQKINELYGPMNSYICHSFGGLALSLYAEKNLHNKETNIVLIAPATETTTALHYFSSKLGISKNLQTAIKNHIFEKSGMKAEEFSVRRALKQVPANILWIHDLDDDVTPWIDAEQVKKDNHPNIQFVNTTGLGHRRIYKDPVVAKQVVEFIAGV